MKNFFFSRMVLYHGNMGLRPLHSLSKNHVFFDRKSRFCGKSHHSLSKNHGFANKCFATRFFVAKSTLFLRQKKLCRKILAFLEKSKFIASSHYLSTIQLNNMRTLVFGKSYFAMFAHFVHFLVSYESKHISRTVFHEARGFKSRI